ncbi:MAG: DUF3887 domain-containing protein [Anaerolineales bacterium]|nr:MAG: DUF3887 domain-containing protein [Anaerolineales bacterium]
MKTKFTTLFVLLIVAVLASACGGSAPEGEATSVLSQEEAAAIVENAMQGLADGDYPAWSRDWSDTMKNAIPEKAFLDYRSQVTAQYGQFVSIESVTLEPGKTQGYVRWAAVCTFENGRIKFNFSFENDGRLIEGVLPEAVQ